MDLNAMLMTDVQRFSYDYEAHVGRLYMAAGTCCDMAACIKFFEGFDPDVIYISTASGTKQDTRYRRIDGKWHAFPSPHGQETKEAARVGRPLNTD